ncbi:putative F-box protein At1g53370 [Salvia splendens]|uniref:putative F-box protein At1g53370 n=1 Tax=Salvia splendens TaxID=180675 RepID=UPI001C25B722|nr:putative F-box protein At1g53370 [Salvia splendens]XP_042035966.1 putative F-box protein At1g53370 [Salvia splendens]
MERNFFTNLPIEITTEILSRLPLRSIALSKCVCKPWINLLDSDDFQLKSPPALALLQQMNSTRCSIFEFEDEDEADEEKSHDLHYIPLTHFDIPNENIDPLAVYRALGPEGYIYDDDVDDGGAVFSIGFGMRKISGQYKVVCINVDVGS